MQMDLRGPHPARLPAACHALWLGLVLAAPWGHAQTPPLADPANAAASVPPPAYRSAFQDLPRGVENGRTDWRSANQAVGRFPRGHADLLKAEEASAPQAPAQPAPGARQP